MRVAIIGVGAVGQACAHLLASRRGVRRLVLANRTKEVADAVRMDLEQSRSWTTPLTALAVEPWRDDAFSGCDVVILTAGPRLRGNEQKADKAADAALVLSRGGAKSIAEALARCAKRDQEALPVLLVVTNPVEATVTWLRERTGWNPARIIGLGTTVEAARFSRFLSDKLNVDATSVWTEIIGEHGPLIGLLDESACQRRVGELTKGAVNLAELLDRTRRAAEEIRKISETTGTKLADQLIGRLEGQTGAEALAPLREALRQELAAALAPPATRFAIAAAALEVVEAVCSERGRVLTVSGFPGFTDVPDVALAVPFIIGRNIAVAPGFRATPFLNDVAKSIEGQVAAMRKAVKTAEAAAGADAAKS